MFLLSLGRATSAGLTLLPKLRSKISLASYPYFWDKVYKERKTETHDAEPWDYHQHVLLCIHWKCQSICKQKAGYLFTAIILCLTIGSGRGPEARSVRRCVCQHCHRPVAVLSNKIPSKQWPSRFPICFPSLFLYALAILSDTAVKWGGKGAGHRERGRGCSHLPIHTAGVLSRSLCKVHV